MRQTKLLILIAFLPFSAFCQTSTTSNDWTKDDRNNVYEDAINMTSKNRNLTQEQRESIALCYLEDITKKYPKKDYYAKIDIEIKRITESTIAQCAKNIGVDMTIKKVEPTTETTKTEPAKVEIVKAKVKKVNEGNFTIEDLVGEWKDENSKMFFNADGTYLQKITGESSSGGTFYIDQNKNIVLDNLYVMEVISFDGLKLNYSQEVEIKKGILGLKKKTEKVKYTYIKQE